MSGLTQLLLHCMSRLPATLYVLSYCSTVGPVLLQHCMACLTATLYVLSYCSTACPVLLQHCISCLTAALCVLFYCSTVCPHLQHCMICLTAASNNKIPSGQNLGSHIGQTSAKVCNPCPVTMWQKYISPITGWDLGSLRPSSCHTFCVVLCCAVAPQPPLR